MIRVKRGNIKIKRHSKILRAAKNFFSTHSKLFRIANTKVIKAFKYAYIGRKQKKRNFKKLWITRINAAILSKTKLSYSKFIYLFKNKKIKINKKLFSQISIINPKLIQIILNKIF